MAIADMMALLITGTNSMSSRPSSTDLWKYEPRRIVPGGRIDVIVFKHQCALDPYIEDPLTLSLEVDLSKMQCDVYRPSGTSNP